MSSKLKKCGKWYICYLLQFEEEQQTIVCFHSLLVLTVSVVTQVHIGGTLLSQAILC